MSDSKDTRTAKASKKKATAKQAAASKAAPKKPAPAKAAAAPVKKTAAKKAPAKKKAAAKAAAASPAAKSRITHEQRWRMISEAAYHRAEKRHFTGGGEVDDWLVAEAEIDAQIEEEGIEVVD